MKPKTEQIFIRKKCPYTGRIYRDVIEAEPVFEINGFRFFYCFPGLGSITDGLIGANCGYQRNFETKAEFIKRAEKAIKDKFEEYVKQVKEANKITTVRKGKRT